MIHFAQRHIGWALALLLAMSAIGLYFYVQYVASASPQAAIDPFVIAFQTVMSGLCVGLVVVFVEKIGGRYSVENRLDQLIETIHDEREDLEVRMDQIRERTENALQLKFGYGFTGVSDDPEELTHIARLKKGRVRWLNTLFRNPQANMEAVLEAVDRGIDVELLMMRPGNPYSDVRGRYTTASYDVDASIASNIEAYKALLSASYKFILISYRDYQSNFENGGVRGSLKIRFYDDPAGLPVLLIDEGNVKEAYSGFYINSVSSKLPYIGWSEKIGGETFIHNLEDYFEKKWFFAKDGDVEKLIAEGDVE